MLQEQLRQSLGRLDGRLAGVAACRSHQPCMSSGPGGPPREAALAAAPGGEVEEPAAQPGPAAAVSLSEPQSPSPAAGPDADQETRLQVPAAAEQQPLQWRLRRRSLAGALDAPAVAAPVPACQAVPASVVAAAAAFDAVCHVNVANVGKPCRLPMARLGAVGSPVQQPADPAGTNSSRQRSVLPPLREGSQWPAGRQASSAPGAASAPMLRSAARAAARPSRMQPLQAGGPAAAWWQPPAQQQQQWHGWGQQQQAQWWQQFPPGWQQYQQPQQQWGALGGIAAAGYGAWQWAQ